MAGNQNYTWEASHFLEVTAPSWNPRWEGYYMSCISSTNSTFHNLRHGQCKGKVLLRGYLALFISRVQRDFTKETDNQRLVFFKNLTKWKGNCLERSPPFSSLAGSEFFQAVSWEQVNVKQYSLNPARTWESWTSTREGLKNARLFPLMHLLLPHYFLTSKESWAWSISALQTATIKKLRGANLSELQNQKPSH